MRLEIDLADNSQEAQVLASIVSRDHVSPEEALRSVLTLAFTLFQGTFVPCHVVSARAEAAVLSSMLRVPVTLGRNLQDKFVYIEPHGASPEVVLDSFALAMDASVLRRREARELRRSPR